MKAENKILGLACLLTQPTVAEAAGEGAPHGELGEEVAVYVTLRSGATALCATADPSGEDPRARRAMTENEFYVSYA
ncbi:MAG: hypothetical protein Q8P98_14365 [Candidatus Rokubacteria bacterium]|nr:hypothetical protein [Candidatus Rokubacteria bacterium]